MCFGAGVIGTKGISIIYYYLLPTYSDRIALRRTTSLRCGEYV